MQEKIDTNRVLLPVLKSPDKLWGCIASNGNVDYSTLTDEMVKFVVKDRETRCKLYCKHVKISIEVIDETELD